MRAHAADGSCHLEVPDTWEIAAPPPLGALLAAVAPAGDGFRPNVVVTRDPAASPTETWDELAQRQLRDLEGALIEYRPIEVRVGEDQLLLHGLHIAAGVGVALQQWIRRSAEGSLVLSVSVPSLEAPALWGVVTALADSWELGS